MFAKFKFEFFYSLNGSVSLTIFVGNENLDRSYYFLFSVAVFASEEDEMAEMQKKLNAEVMEKPFSVEDEKKIDSYIKSAMAKDLKPEKKVDHVDFVGPTTKRRITRVVGKTVVG